MSLRGRNRDHVPRPYGVVVRQGEDVTNEFAGVLPADAEQSVETVTSADG